LGGGGRSGQRPTRRFRTRGSALILVRLLLFLALAAIAVSAVMYLFSKDRRYLRFIWQVVKFTVVILAVVLIFFAFERIVGPML
jgi:preprotein translocase subunit SecG